MPYEDWVSYKWADKTKTIVRRTRVDHPADLAEIQTAIDEAAARIAELPEPEPHPTQEGYEQKWADTGMSFEAVCELIDRRNEEDPDVQERIELETVITPRLKQDIIDWRKKVDG